MKPAASIGTDGDFGPETEGAVKQFQKQHGLEPNGIVDAKTWKVLGPLVMEDEPAPEPAVVNAEEDKKSPLDPLDGPPFVTCKAWAIIDGNSGEFLAGDHQDEKRAPASTTKMMTAYLITQLVQKDPKVVDEIVTFSERADKTPGSSSEVRAGEKLPVRELLYGMMLPSGNDATVAFAEHFGDRLADDKDKVAHLDAYDSFVSAMNRKAAELGMKSTHFNNPNGLPSAGHLTTVRDLARLAYVAFQVPEFRKVVGTAQHGYTLDSISGYKRNIVWHNTNQLLRIKGYDGIKTGTTNAAGCCVVSTGERNGRRLIVVVLGATLHPRAICRFAKSIPLGVDTFVEDATRYGEDRQQHFKGKVMTDISKFCAVGAVLTTCVCLAAVVRPAVGDNAAVPTDRTTPIILTDRARELHAHSLVIDGHNDMPWEIRKQGGSSFDKMDISKLQPTLQTDIPRLRKGGVGAQFWSVWVPVELGYQGKALATTLEQIELVKRMMARYPDTFELALTADDIERIHAKGKIASLIGVEGGHCIEESLAALEKLYNLGTGT